MFRENRPRTSYVHNTPCFHSDSHRLYLFARHLGCTKKQALERAIDALEQKHRIDGVTYAVLKDMAVEQGGQQ